MIIKRTNKLLSSAYAAWLTRESHHLWDILRYNNVAGYVLYKITIFRHKSKINFHHCYYTWDLKGDLT